MKGISRQLRVITLMGPLALFAMASYFSTATEASATWFFAHSAAITPSGPGPSAALPVCSFSISPSSACLDSSGGEESTDVTAPAGCAWTAVSNASWITFTSGQTGVGNGTVTLAIALNTTQTAREGTVIIADHLFSVGQEAAFSCSLPLSPLSQSFSAAGGTGKVTSRAPGPCTCSTVTNSDVLWITITSVDTTPQTTTVHYTVAPNTDSSPRMGGFPLAGQDFTVNQAGAGTGPCSYSIAPSSQSFGVDGGSGNFNLSVGPDCTWSVSSAASWITINSSDSGIGDTAVMFTVDQNTSGIARASEIVIGDQSFAVSQDGLGCAYSISPGFQEFTSSGGSGTIAVAANDGCDWTALSNADWITVTSTPAGSGNGSVSYSASANQTGAARQGTITVAGHSFTVDEASAGDQADLFVSIAASPKPVATGTRLTYTIVVSNSGPSSATGVSLRVSTPPGTSFASLESPGSVSSPTPGGSGLIQCSLGSISPKGSATITLVANVLAPSGSTLVATPEVTSLTPDPVASNNSVSDITNVVGGGIVSLSWDQPPSTPDDPTPPPTNVTIGIASSSAASASNARRTTIKPSGSTCSLNGYNVYISSALPVETTPANLWETVPVANTTTAPAGPAGSFYVVTSLWNCSGTIVESGGGVSSSGGSVGVPSGPTVNSVKVGNKIKAFGTGFTDPVQVFIDGVAFVKASSLRKGGALVVQKGSLIDGTPITGATPAGKTVIITFQNPDGGVGAFSFTAQ